jgi:hypothetical protein
MSDKDKYWRIAPPEQHPVSRHNWSKPRATTDEARADRAEIAFQNPDWSLGNILSWIAFRDRERICELRDRRDLLAHRRYSSMGAPSVKGADKADRLLLYALKDGGVMAIKNGKRILGRCWFGKSTSELSDDLRFQRIEALKRWPEVNGAQKQPRGGGPRPVSSKTSRRTRKGLAPTRLLHD